tara:strand:- start:1553 stop:2134 length:582 start_codon:yes stop_codon:yes gene_type:complete
MINHEHKFLFLHLPKTGGTSINKFFNDKFDNNKREFGHPYLSDYKCNNFDDYFKFTVVRNPYDRLVSAFFYMKEYSNFQSDINFRKKWKLEHDTFESFVIEKLPIIVGNKNTRPRHFKPQVEFGTAGLDYIGSFVTMQDDMNFICDEIGIDRQDLPHVNSSNHKRYDEYYNEELLNIVKTLYINDFNNYNHLW